MQVSQLTGRFGLVIHNKEQSKGSNIDPMIGVVLSLLVSWAYLSTSWAGPYSQDSIFDELYWSTYLAMGITLLLGIFLIPRTIGMMYTPVVFLLPVAFFISFFRHGFTYALSQVLIGIAGFLITFLIGRFRPEST